MDPVIPHEARYIYGGLVDRWVRPGNVHALWEHWDEPALYAEISPHTKAGNFETPTLVIHGSDDMIPVESSKAWAAALPDARLLQTRRRAAHRRRPRMWRPI